ncbi:shisa family member 5 [Phyllostomus discolor]|uniref:Protein shisa-5 n=1 Tax=Phyllostomus discolor TaxID=89673 RepID=A0A834E281_9CHIR|nr:shisa family member 5 [Phyllostomus discolor]
MGFGATVAVGVTIFVLFIVTIIACFTCSCCCLYKMCRRPRPVVTTTTSTTVVHAPYPQPPSVPPTYPGPSYQGYQPIAPQPGMVAAPYPTQYPPPYPAQPTGPPASLQPGVHGPPKGRLLSAHLHLRLPLDVSCVCVWLCRHGPFLPVRAACVCGVCHS